MRKPHWTQTAEGKARLAAIHGRAPEATVNGTISVEHQLRLSVKGSEVLLTRDEARGLLDQLHTALDRPQGLRTRHARPKE
jgi:hypothetical protein